MRALMLGTIVGLLAAPASAQVAASEDAPAAGRASAASEAAATRAAEAAIVEAVQARMGTGAAVVVDGVSVEGEDAAGDWQALPSPAARLGEPSVFTLVEAATRRRVGRATATVAVSVPHARAGRGIARGEVLEAADLVVSRRPLDALPIAPLPSVDEVVGGRANRPIEAGEIVSAGAVTLVPAVRSGQAVRAIVRFEGGEISARLIARQNGARGDLIRVVNRESRRELRAVVIGEGLVEVVP